MLMATTLCYTLAVAMGIWLGLQAMQKRRPFAFLKPLHVLFAAAGTVFMLIALAHGHERVMLDVALVIAVIVFGVIMSEARRRGYMIPPLYVCHILLAAILYISVVCFTIFPNF
ncbi:hypothetical protein AA101099_1625 [Neoasaia chiangmaiensis NBRC 101099]|uniref:Uncharacterized protein n=1 Tax=Neoasaia chiangmaiensis TaxID=320497 RepID=A0A1U9KRA7_9PROT|nr:hypothetical protein [Neoasaia chiangmaiensis]AQS88394.1 hypothetical protein A0U93_11080 [Neoasaia chiangmaiensis]GBR39361.1 hypothetical protein AA101099_1625 [Neoasaia chiangmaiensis NBRC 101099]GEN14542.1 hypothetical protein NCH01_09730 [Neoasaia chiangmaiensis]